MHTPTETHELWTLREGEGPLVATAIHAAHAVRDELLHWLSLEECVRAREEDPYVDVLAREVPVWMIPTRSRFEVDLNRPREQAVYRTPEMAWGLQVWKVPLPRPMVRRSLAAYDAFYARLYRLLDGIRARHGGFVLLDLHDYNHRRAGPHAPPDDPRRNPEVNLGTGTMDRAYWAPVVERFLADARGFTGFGRPLDVRENVKFRGRELARRLHRDFPGTGCVLAVEFKKFFMDEWTGILDVERFDLLRALIRHLLPGLREALETVLERGARTP
jgi:hypothetical protein